jgi:hypothetical protein
MKKTGLALGALALSLAGLFALSGQVEAYRGDPSVQGPDYSAERHQAMTQAFENHDYDAWRELMQDRGRVMQVVNQDNFARFAEAHQLAQEGKLDESKQIREELGLGLRNGSGQGQKGNGNGMGRYNR